MKKITNKLIALLLALMLVITVIPTTSLNAVAAPKVSKITIKKPLTSLLVLKKGKTYKLKSTVTVKPNKAKYKKVTYKSSKPKIISVSKAGKLKALKSKGKAKITIASVTNKKKKATLTVQAGRPITKLAIANQTIKMDSSQKLAVSIKPSNATIKELEFTSSNPNIANVAGGGYLNGYDAGTTTITAVTTDGSNKKVTFTVTVEDPAFLTGTPAKSLYPNFKLGMAVPASVLINDNSVGSKMVKYHFNSVTMENDMKPDSMLDWSGCEANIAAGNDTPAIKFDVCDKALTYARDHGLQMRFHTFVWYSQTPEFFFHEDYNTDKPLVSKEKMLARMQSYITQIIDHIETNFPGVIYAWDVVNEAVEDGSGGDKEFFNVRVRNNNWYKTVGTDFVKKAFEYADAALSKYPSTAKLFYNDYNTYMRTKHILGLIADVNKEKKICDGIGMQSHLDTNFPSMTDYNDTIKAFSDAGFEINITELDVCIQGVEDESALAYQGQVYRTLMDMYGKYPAITSVTVWGTDDGSSWRSPFSPLLLDSYFNVKPAYLGFMKDPSITPLAY